MRRQLPALTLVLFALVWLLLLGGCVSTSKSIQITGESLVGLATQFDVVSKHMTAKCLDKTYTVRTCTDYRLFGEKFKASYPAAKTLWNAATQFEDQGLKEAAAVAVLKLSDDLAPFVAMMGGR